jgi:hypothetical protein
MKMRSLVAASVVVLAAVMTGVSTVAAAAPIDVTIHIVPNQIPPPPFGIGPCPPFACGHWDLTSSQLTDSGIYQPLGARVAPSDRPPFSPGPLFEEFLLPSASGHGEFSIKTEERIIGTLPNLTQVGQWQIEPGSGTGIYADIRGHGDVAFSSTPITLTLTGVISGI